MWHMTRIETTFQFRDIEIYNDHGLLHSCVNDESMTENDILPPLLHVI